MVNKSPLIFPGSPHVVVLGSGASRAAFLNGDAEGRKVPLMNELIDCLELGSIFNKLSDIHKWLKPLIDEENKGEEFSGVPCPPI